MALSNTNISTALVGMTLGTGSRDIGELCTNVNVNKWSKWKPVKVTKITGIALADLAAANYGLQAAFVDNDYEAASLLSWAYNKPTGGATYPYRLGDFRNYDHTAQPPITIPSNFTINQMHQSTATIFFLVNEGDTYVIGIDDLNLDDNLNLPMADKYIGVVLVTGSDKYPVTASQSIENGGNSIALTVGFPVFPSISVGSSVVYDAYYLLFRDSRAQGSILGSNRYFPIPTNGSTVGTVTLINSFNMAIDMDYVASQGSYPFTWEDILDFTVGGLYLVTAKALFFQLDITNSSGADYTLDFSEMEIQLSKTFNRSTQITIPAVVYSGSSTVSTKIVASGTTETLAVGTTNGLALNDSTPPAEAPVTSGTQITVFVRIIYRGSTIKSTMINVEAL